MAAYDTTKGISLAGIPKMKDAIAKYQQNVTDACNKALNYGGYKTAINAAIKGEKTQASLNTKLKNIKSKQDTLIKQLSMFANELAKIESAYRSQDSKFTF